ncbi:uncharacterized protein LOC129738354 [Uranotaenia lowii]|uniref:uncharacterized protein LOC129738354 n=1 Tax=Uranotaenia lowii TaxID=190385 RepID=UPI00247901CE|nr:uncharacterized protein LOC129738354 [Uranotaenia lowii]
MPSFSVATTSCMGKLPVTHIAASLASSVAQLMPFADILFAVNCLSRFNKNPGPKHWMAVKHVMRYLRGTSKHGLKYMRKADINILGYCDADWGSDPDERKSTSGKQTTVALSTCEAEYMALSAAVQEASWWHGITAMFGQQTPIEIRCDNQSCLAIAKNGSYNPRTKHIDIRNHYVRDVVERGVVDLIYVGMEEQMADGLTKPLQSTKFEINRSSMGITTSSGGVLK